jgi:hypothetical protein
MSPHCSQNRQEKARENPRNRAFRLFPHYILRSNEEKRKYGKYIRLDAGAIGKEKVWGQGAIPERGIKKRTL